MGRRKEGSDGLNIKKNGACHIRVGEATLNKSEFLENTIHLLFKFSSIK